MTFKNMKYLLTVSLFTTVSLTLCAETFLSESPKKIKEPVVITDTLSWSVSFMKKVFNGSGEWFVTNANYQKSIKGIIDYAENEPIDTVVVKMDQMLNTDTIPFIFSRKAENIPNKRIVPGYLSAEEIERQTDVRRMTVVDSLHKTLIPVPDPYLEEGLARVSLIPEGNYLQMLASMDRTMPGSFSSKFYKSWGNVKLPYTITPAEIDSIRLKLFIWTRQTYNDSLLFHTRDSLITSYREGYVATVSAEAAILKRNHLNAVNRELLHIYNESEIRKVNDSIRMALHFLTNHAAFDSTLVTLTNLSGTKTQIWTANQPMAPMRIFLKNEQNDSLSVIIYNDKRDGLRLVIDDGVKFQRFTETQKKEIHFDPKKPDSRLHKVNFRKVNPLPWKLYGTGTVGFTQTAISNWAKGGESSLSLLLIGRYIANYSKNMVKWENMAEFRLGTFASKTRGVEKNEDRIELQSRAGYAAYKKWYYSAEFNFRTQVAKGYKYPDKVNPISAFMSPGYLTFSLGMDYKPNKNFSLFLSPLTSKTTFIRDTALINPVNYGVPAGEKRHWEPGMIVKLNFHWPIVSDIIYDTRVEIFNNYNYTFQKLNLNWEQTLVMQVTPRIGLRVMTQLIYDYNVLFSIKDESGKEIGKEPKWQFKELFTVGFNYKF
jgi:hypothetical protein